MLKDEVEWASWHPLRRTQLEKVLPRDVENSSFGAFHDNLIFPDGYVARRNLFLKLAFKYLAKNKRGYHNLAKMSSIAFVDGFYYVPRIDGYPILS